MAQTVRMAWNAKRHWLAAGFLASTSLFLLLMFMNWHNERRGIASQRATGLSSTVWRPTSMWQQQSILPPSLTRQQARTGMDHLEGTLGGVAGGVLRAAVDASPADHIDPLVIRTGTLEIIATDPSQAAEQLRSLATHFSGFAVSSKVSAGEEGTRSAQILRGQAVAARRTFCDSRLRQLYGGAFFESPCDSDMGFHHHRAAEGRMVNAAAYPVAVLPQTNPVVTSSSAVASPINRIDNLVIGEFWLFCRIQIERVRAFTGKAREPGLPVGSEHALRTGPAI